MRTDVDVLYVTENQAKQIYTVCCYHSLTQIGAQYVASKSALWPVYYVLFVCAGSLQMPCL